ncbi:MAG: hypothetical protein AB2693_29895, partial [Candidatus Thiodiazotropha sp.]
RQRGQGERADRNVNTEFEEIEEGAVGGTRIQSTPVQEADTQALMNSYRLADDKTMSPTDLTRERDSLLTLDETPGSTSLRDLYGGYFSDRPRGSEHEKQISAKETGLEIFSAADRKKLESEQRELEDRITRLRNFVGDPKELKNANTREKSEVKDALGISRKSLKTEKTETGPYSPREITLREDERRPSIQQSINPRGAFAENSFEFDRNSKSQNTYALKSSERESVMDDVFFKEREQREQSKRTEKRQEKMDEITYLKERDRFDYPYPILREGQFERKSEERFLDTERMIKREEDQSEQMLMERLKFLQLQERILDDENRKRVEEEQLVKERMAMIKHRSTQMDEERRRSHKLMEIKMQQDMIEKNLRLKIQQQIQYDERLRLLREEENRLMKENALLDLSKPALFRDFQNMRSGDLPEKKDLLQETEIQETTSYLEKKSGNIDPDSKTKSKEEELDRREEYLKKLEEELVQKEEDIRASLHFTPATTVQITTDSHQLTTKPPEVTHLLKPYITTFSGTDPVPKNESTFEEWKVETECLRRSPRYHEDTVNQSIRNSLKGQARKVLVTLGAQATNAQIIEKLESVFGNVASGESILQEFYTATQKPNESVALWGIRIEEILQKAIEKGHVNSQQKNGMLKNKFWRALYDKDLKNATRVHFEAIESFELLRRKVRAEEYEMAANKSVPEKEKVEIKPKPAAVSFDKKAEVNTVEVQHQPVQQDLNTKLLKDLVKRMESIENRLTNIEKPRQGYRWNQADWRNKKSNEQPKAKVATEKATEKKEPLNQ